MIKAILVVKGEEPKVVEVEKDINAYCEVLRGALSDSEKDLSDIVGVDFFSIEVERVSGMVEEYSACHPYERNRNWHGPALFTEFDEEGATVSMSEENIKKIQTMFALGNEANSPSQFINDFLNKYAVAEVHSVTKGNHQGTLNTMDAADYIKKETDKEAIQEIEKTFKRIVTESERKDLSIEDGLSTYLKCINEELFENMTRNFDSMFFNDDSDNEL